MRLKRCHFGDDLVKTLDEYAFSKIKPELLRIRPGANEDRQNRLGNWRDKWTSVSCFRCRGEVASEAKNRRVQLSNHRNDIRIHAIDCIGGLERYIVNEFPVVAEERYG
jgi:hypothetical protein